MKGGMIETQLWLHVCFVVPYKRNTVALTVSQTRIQHVALKRFSH